MKYIYFTVFAAFFLIISCKTNKNGITGKNQTTFGEDFTVKNVMKYDDMLKKLSPGKELEVQVEGKVDAVCQVKGCWMNIVSTSNPNAEKMFVKFHNYGFFMPLDLAGKDVIMNGKAFVQETSVDELRHYAEDAGKSPDEIAKITTPKKELKFMATGVKIKG
ncbi:MAG: hypothetical protein RLZZ546_3224 [Bacteroidota bacterium]|jgi:hypothetical protein